MNNIYKVIWSKAKNCYVVASEIAKSHTKSASGSEKIGGVARHALLALGAACAIACGGFVNVGAAETVEAQITGGSTATVYTKEGTESYVQKNTYTKSQTYTQEQVKKLINDLKTGDVATNKDNITTNKDNITTLEGKTAGLSPDGKSLTGMNSVETGALTVTGQISNGADVTTTLKAINDSMKQTGENKTAIDDLKKKTTQISYADGEGTKISGVTIKDGNIIGNGNSAITGLTNVGTLSINGKNLEGNMVATEKEVKDAVKAETDAREAADTALGQRIDAEIANRITSDTALDQKINGEIANRITSDTALDQKINKEIQDRDAADAALEVKITKNSQDIARLDENGVKYDTAVKDTITLKGANGTKITNLKDADLSDSSSDAVTGKQLNKTNKDLKTEAQTRQDMDTLLSNRADALEKNTGGITRNDAKDETYIEKNVTVDNQGSITAKGKVTANGGVDAGAGAITTTGAVNAGSLNVTDASHLKGDVVMDKKLSVTGDTSLGKTNVNDALNVTGASDLKGDVTLGTPNGTNKVTVNGTANFNAQVNMANGLTVTNGDTTLKDTTVKGNLNVTGTITTDKMIFGDKTTNNYTEIDHGKVTSKNLVVNAAGETISSSSTFNAKENKVGFANSATGDQSFHKQTSDVIMDNVKDRDNSNNRTQTKTETKDIITDKDGNSSTTSQTASENKTYLKDKDGKNTNSTIDTAKGYDKTIKGENGKTSTKQEAGSISSTVYDKDGKVKASSEMKEDGSITNNATGDMTNTVGGKLTTTVNGQATENFNGGLNTTVTGTENHTVTGKQTNTVKGGQENIISGGQINNITGDQTTTVTGKVTENYNGGQETKVTGDKKTTVTGKTTEEYKGGLETTVTGDEKHTVTGNQTTNVTGDILNTAKNITNKADEKLTDQVGTNTRVIDSDSITDTVGTKTNRKIEDGKITDTAGDFTVTTDEANGTTFAKTGGSAAYSTEAGAPTDTNIAGNHITTGRVDANELGVSDKDGDNTANLTVEAGEGKGVKASAGNGTTTGSLDVKADEVGSSVTDGTGKGSTFKQRIDAIMGNVKTDAGESDVTQKGDEITSVVGKGEATNSRVTQKKGSLEAAVTDGTNTNVSYDIANASAKVLTDGTKVNKLQDNLDSSEKTITNGTYTTSKLQTALDITNTAKDGTIKNDAKDIVNNASNSITDKVGDHTRVLDGEGITDTVGGSTFKQRIDKIMMESKDVSIKAEETLTNEAKVITNKASEVINNEAININNTATGIITSKASEIKNQADKLISNKVGENTSEYMEDGKITTSIKDGAKSTVTIQNADGLQTGVTNGTSTNASATTATSSAQTIASGGKANSVITTIDGTQFVNTDAATPVTGESGAGTADRTTIKGNTITTGKVKMDYAEVMKDLGVHGSAKVDNNLEVGGTSTLKGDVTMKSNATVEKDLTVKGTTNLKNTNVDGNLDVTGDAAIHGNQTIDGTLKVTKKATFEDSVDIAKDLSVVGDVTARSYKVGDKTYISADGINANDQKITNVADGSISEGSKDAVNGGQLYGMKTDLEHKVDKVGANAAAMANLHPMEFDPDSKWNIAAAMGNYGSETATAIGAFYRPNEDVMVNFSTAFGTGENMVGGGVSVRLGKGSNKLSREESNALKDQVNDLTARMDALLSVLNPNMSKDFPDVPENHWAYEAVSRLAGNDIVQGYPDGEFHGDRTMTRYEMAEIIYNALSRGAEAERELVEEFKPELQAMAASEKATAERAEG